MRAIQNAGGHGSGGGEDAAIGGERRVAIGEGSAKEGLARGANQNRKTKLRERGQLCKQLVILRVAFAEADPRIEQHAIGRNSRRNRRLTSVSGPL